VGHIVIHHRCRSRLVGGAEALSGCSTTYSNSVSVFQISEMANLEIDPNERFSCRAFSRLPPGHAGEGGFVRRNGLIAERWREAFAIAIMRPRCPRVREDTPAGRVPLGSKNPAGLTGFDVKGTFRIALCMSQLAESALQGSPREGPESTIKSSFNCEREIGFTAHRRPQPDANRLRRALPRVHRAVGFISQLDP
jgi:hypothetical protein